MMPCRKWPAIGLAKNCRRNRHRNSPYGALSSACISDPSGLILGKAAWLKTDPSRRKAFGRRGTCLWAGFLNFVVEKHDKEVVRKLNAAMRQGKYSPNLWKEYTGKTPEDLWK